MTWRLVSQSFRLLREEPALLIFPVLSTLGVVALSIPISIISEALSDTIASSLSQ